jgi:tRNA nucleotidyltransferase (CCA-adding enzyme)
MDQTLYCDWSTGVLQAPFDLYLVGGAVRDKLLGREPKDFDFVAVGATQSDFLKVFPRAQAVGKSFPVYLVEGLGEVAFARKERKLGPYHTDFEVLFDPSVSLDEDLSRRDLTINAIAMRPDGSIIDPFGGAKDLLFKKLRHVGPAFSEDALRLYRLARFAAQLDFTIDPATIAFTHHVPMSDLVALPGERVCEEFRKALRSAHPRRFVEELERMGVLGLHFPELAHLRKVPAGPPEHHPEGDSLTHSLMALDEFSGYTVNSEDAESMRLSVLFHDLGKGVTPVEKWPSHPGHDLAGVPLVEAACARLKMPNAMTKAAVMVCREHMRVHAFLEMRKGKQVDLILAADKTCIKAEGLANCSIADCMGRGADRGNKVQSSRPASAMLMVAQHCREEKGHPIPEVLKGKDIGLHVRAKKGTAVRRWLKNYGF